MNNLTISAKITVENTGKVFDTLNDWGLAVGNNDYIGDPVQETFFEDIPGASAMLDLSEVLCNRPIFKYRPIKVLLGGKRPRLDWDSIISTFRNEIEGKVVKITFSNDLAYYWRGRVNVTDFQRTRGIGQFNLNIPKADPYKYEILSSEDEWEWDSFDFENGVIRTIGKIDINNTSIVIPKGNMLVAPEFIIENIAGQSLYVAVNGTKYKLLEGYNRFPQILVAGEEEVELKFMGRCTAAIRYRGGSL